MSAHVVAMLVVMAAVAQRGQVRRPPVAPPGGTVISVVTIFEGERKRHYVTISMQEAKRAEEDDAEAPPRPVQHINLQNAVIERDTFDRWVFDDEKTTKEHWQHLEEVLDEKIRSDAVGRTLTRAQRARLRVAGLGDIKRFFDRVEDERSQFEKERQTWRTGIAALRRLDPLAKVYSETPFDAGSLYSKMIRRVDAESAAGH